MKEHNSNMKTTILLSSLLLLLITINAQKLKIGGYDDPFNTNEFLYIDNLDSSLIIDYDLTTNKEYLTYMAWIYKVWIDYPENYQNALPNPKYANELFNPEFAHKPVHGVNLEQASKYCEWRADRYNEYILVREGIQFFDLGQLDEESFNTNSYLCGQYIGLVKAALQDQIFGGFRSVWYSDYFMLPSFHVASKDEVNEAIKMFARTHQPEFKKIKSPLDGWLIAILESMVVDNKNEIDKNHPLINYYNQCEMGKDKYDRIKPLGKKFVKQLNKSHTPEIQLGNTENVMYNPKNLNAETMNKNKDIIYFSSYNRQTDLNPFEPKNQRYLQEKDSIGRMPFIWIGDEVDGTPILLKREEVGQNEYDENSGFFCVINIPYRLYLKREYKYALEGKRYLFKK